MSQIQLGEKFIAVLLISKKLLVVYSSDLILTLFFVRIETSNDKGQKLYFLYELKPRPILIFLYGSDTQNIINQVFKILSIKIHNNVACTQAN